MKSVHLLGAIGALAFVSPALAGIVEVGSFVNTSDGIDYTGPYADFITFGAQGDRGQWKVITIDLAGLIDAAGYDAFTSVTVKDDGNNVYTGLPGADIDLFRMTGLDAGIAPTFIYDGPTTYHHGETAAQLFQRVEAPDWGTRGGQLPSMEFVCLGRDGTLMGRLNEMQMIREHGVLKSLSLDLSEAGNSEHFSLFIEAFQVPGPGALVLLGLGIASPRRRRG